MSCIALDFPSRSSVSAPSRDKKVSPAFEIFKKVAILSVKEAAVAACFAGVSYFFVATTALPTLLTLAVTMLAINTLLSSVNGGLTYLRLHRCPQGKINYLLGKVITVLDWIAPLQFAKFDDITRNTLVHEGGHALAAGVLFKNARPSISLTLDGGGATSYYIKELSWLGNQIGKLNSKIIIAAAGPFLEIVTATAMIGCAYRVREKNPELRRYLLCSAIMSIFNSVKYALSALSNVKFNPAHDFMYLWKIGTIHPVVSAVSMIALPALVQLGLYLGGY